MRRPAAQQRKENQGLLRGVRERCTTWIGGSRTQLRMQTRTYAYSGKGVAFIQIDRQRNRDAARRPLAAHHHLCKHLYHAASSAAAYAPGGPSLVVLFAYGGAQDGEAAGNVLGRGMEKQ